jgi:RNA polymerase sigma-70 factor, ECF subfamily
MTAPDYDAFFRAEYPRLVAVGNALCGDREVARDLAQETLLRAYRSWASIGTMERPGAWCRRVLVNLTIDRGRRGGREQRALARIGSATATTGLPPGAGEAEQFWAAVRMLPERQRVAVVLHYLEDQPLDAIGEVLGIATGTVKASLHRARRTLATALSSWKEQS